MTQYVRPCGICPASSLSRETERNRKIVSSRPRVQRRVPLAVYVGERFIPLMVMGEHCTFGMYPFLVGKHILLYARRDIHALIVRASRQQHNSFRGMNHEARIPKRMMSRSCYDSSIAQ